MRAFLFAAVAALLLGAAPAAADAPVRGWQLMAQDFNDGGPVGQPRAVPCRADVDYVKGVIADLRDCLPDGRYLTEEECVRAEGKKIFIVSGADRLLGSVAFCFHKAEGKT